MIATKDIVVLSFVAIATLCVCVVSSLSSSPLASQRTLHKSSTSNTIESEQITSITLQTSKNLDNDNQMLNSRRSFFGNVWKSLFVGTAAAALKSKDDVANAVVDEDFEDVYFGVGCFWHIQHEFILAEKSILQRTNQQLTSRAGYAGGTKTDAQNRVCYHNIMGVADYGSLGHGEVVGMTIPKDKIIDFSEVYFSLFNPRTKDRVDPMDRGSEYRSLIGFPGGVNHPSYAGIQEAATKSGFKLVAGKGNDPDTIGKQIVYVYDTASFPFYQAEIYHQYHNDFQEKPYGLDYNKLADAAFEDGRLKVTGCPDRV